MVANTVKVLVNAARERDGTGPVIRDLEVSNTASEKLGPGLSVDSVDATTLEVVSSAKFVVVLAAGGKLAGLATFD